VPPSITDEKAKQARVSFTGMSLQANLIMTSIYKVWVLHSTPIRIEQASSKLVNIRLVPPKNFHGQTVLVIVFLRFEIKKGKLSKFDI
jgi:hypothetical protein